MDIDVDGIAGERKHFKGLEHRSLFEINYCYYSKKIPTYLVVVLAPFAMASTTAPLLLPSDDGHFLEAKT